MHMNDFSRNVSHKSVDDVYTLFRFSARRSIDLFYGDLIGLCMEIEDITSLFSTWTVGISCRTFNQFRVI